MKEIGELTLRETLACTLWGEARGESVTGMTAVAAVVMNRAKNPGWWGTTPRAVCLAHQQFSCWNDDDPNRLKMLRVADAPDDDYRSALAIVDRALAGNLPDPTHGADHYVMTNIIARTGWTHGKTPCAVIGHHSFYKLGLGG
ncbi:MAG: cell wall hydrolase [Alphaproteobacteria bacterium]|nr:cell wall hydrolase [Alphaproteobacteria bacterium]